MPTLEACKEMIAQLSEAKKWSKDPNIKFLYAFVELGEAVDAWKKRKPPSKVIEEISTQSTTLSIALGVSTHTLTLTSSS